MMFRRLVLISLLGMNAAALAHNVVSGVYADGMTIEGEIGFSSGAMAEDGLLVEVFNEAGDKLGETHLDEHGQFVYTAKRVQAHTFKADLSSGHIAQMTLEADELSDVGVASLVAPSAALDSAADQVSQSVNANLANSIVSTNAGAKASAGSFAERSANTSVAGGLVVTNNSGAAISAAELQGLIRSAVAQQIRPLQKELSAYKEKVMLRDIAGGLGFIFGLFGIAAWASSRRKTGTQ